MRKYSYSDVLASLSLEKRKADGPWTRFVLRPLSMPTAWACLRLGIGANAVTYAGVAISVAGGLLMASGAPWAVWVGIACFFVFGIFDCADGNIARTLKTGSPWGEWVDAMGGYVAYTAILLGAGAAAERQSPGMLAGLDGAALPWSGGWSLVGGIAASANVYMRLLYQGFKSASPDRGKDAVSAEKGLSETIGITGALVPAFAIAYAAGGLGWVLLAYVGIYGGGAFLVTLKLVLRVERDTRAASRSPRQSDGEKR
jgi:phosphatidylglycerophosphate synthase